MSKLEISRHQWHAAFIDPSVPGTLHGAFRIAVVLREKVLLMKLNKICSSVRHTWSVLRPARHYCGLQSRRCWTRLLCCACAFLG
jgi:hypothetical protein